MNVHAILGLRFDSDDLERSVTIREYLVELLTHLWIEGESFSGKRPFGNSGWQSDLYAPLIRAGVISGTFDEYGYIYQCDEDAGNAAIQRAIAHLAEPQA